MSDFYKEMQGIATDLITEFNQGTVEYVSVASGTGPVDEPGPSVPTLHPVKAVARGVQRRYITGSDIVQSDMQMTIPVTPGVVPDMKGFVRGDGHQFKIVGVKQIPPFGTPVSHVIIFRK